MGETPKIDCGAFSLEKTPVKGPEIWKVVFDLPDEKVNKFSQRVLNDFVRLLDEIDRLVSKGTIIDALVLVSGKPGNFIAGADIELIRSAKTESDAFELAHSGHKLFNRWEDLPFPTVVAIDGACLGGGFELSLSSSAIVISNDSAARVGLPEVMLGIIPGLGGCVRLPRKAGLATSLDMILTGKTLTGDRAFKAGIAEVCLPKENFKEAAFDWVAKNLNRIKSGERMAKEPKLAGMGGPIGSVLEHTSPGRAFILKKARDGVHSKTRGKYPAPLEALSVIGDTGGSFGEKLKGDARDHAQKREAQGFARMASTEVSKNLIRIFFLTEGVKKSKGVSGAQSKSVRSAAVLGAGVMGGGIAQLFAEKGITTRMKDLNAQALGAGIQAAQAIFKKQVSRKKITKRELLQKMNLIAPVMDFSGFNATELVVEAIVEKMDIKQKVLAELEGYVSDTCVLASNTSSLSISKMQEAMKKPERFAGMHFFNPVSKMPLVEVIRGSKSSDDAVSAVYQLSKQLGKTPIVVKDAPGFLVNRLLMPYLNEATWILSEGATIEEIDEAMLDFGMPMGPIELIDEVGVDVGEKVAHILHDAFGARMNPAPMNDKIIKAGRLGKKNGKGFYEYQGREKTLNPEIYSILGVTPKSGSVSREEIVRRCTLAMINEASRCLTEKVVETADDVDLGMIMGTGFPPFRGGLLRYADTVGLRELVTQLRALHASGKFGSRFDPDSALVNRAEKGQTFHQ